MIRLTHTDGKAIYFAPELITTIKIKNGYTHIWSTDVSQPAPVTEPPEEVVRKVLEWRLAMIDYHHDMPSVKTLAMAELMRLAGLEEQG